MSQVEAIHSILRQVTDADIDGMGHANNTVYVRWMEECATEHSAAAGWDTAAYQSLGGGWVVRRHEILYLRPARLGMPVRIDTWVPWFKRATSRRCYRITDASTGEELARATTDWAFVDIPTGRPQRIPDRISSSFPTHTGPFDSV